MQNNRRAELVVRIKIPSSWLRLRSNSDNTIELSCRRASGRDPDNWLLPSLRIRRETTNLKEGIVPVNWLLLASKTSKLSKNGIPSWANSCPTKELWLIFKYLIDETKLGFPSAKSNGPENWLLLTSTYSTLPNWERRFIISPEKLLSRKSRYFSLSRLPKPEGTMPSKLFEERFKSTKFLNLATPEGTNPWNKLHERSKNSRDSMEPMFEIVPITWLFEMDKFLSILRPARTGKLKLPIRPMSFKVIDATRPLTQTTPYQFWGHPSDDKDLEFHETRTCPDGSFWMPFLSSKSALKSDCPKAITASNNSIKQIGCIASTLFPNHKLWKDWAIEYTKLVWKS